jgi:hypothetical protein
MRYNGVMTKGEARELLNRVLSWPDDDQEKIVRFVRELERWRADHDIVDDEGEQAHGGYLNA